MSTVEALVQWTEVGARVEVDWAIVGLILPGALGISPGPKGLIWVSSNSEDGEVIPNRPNVGCLISDVGGIRRFGLIQTPRLREDLGLLNANKS